MLKAAPERLEKHFGRSAASHLRLEALPASFVSSFFDVVACLVSDEVAAYHARITDVLTSGFESLQMDLRSIVEL